MSRAAVICVCLLAMVAGGMFAAGPAFAGTWTVDSCKLPTGSPAPTEGWSTGKLGSPGSDSGDSNTCATGGALTAFDSGAAVQSPYSGPEWVFTAPAGSTIAGGTVTASLTAPHGQAWIGTPTAAYESADVIANCQYNDPCGSTGTNTATFPITHTGGSSLYAIAVCVGTVEGATTCPAEGGTNAQVAISRAQIVLANSATPAAKEVGGPLLSSPARGTQEITLNASDPEGPGIYRVSIQAEGKSLYEGTPDTNGGACVPIGEGEGGLVFDHLQPCPAQESIAIPIDTTSLPDGTHALKVSLTDAAGNTEVVYDAQITTHNAPEDTTAPAVAGQAQVGTSLASQPGEWAAPEGAGKITYAYHWQACNSTGEACQPIAGATSSTYTPTPGDVGDTIRVTLTAADRDGKTSASSPPTATVQAPSSSLGALPGPGTATAALRTPATPTLAPAHPKSKPHAIRAVSRPQAHAVIHLGSRRKLHRSFAGRALLLRGRLLTRHHHPIAGARLLVLQRVGHGRFKAIGHAKTGRRGAFRAHIPPGPSRLLKIAYRGAAKHGYAAVAKVHETVRAGVRLHIDPRRTSSHGTIILHGRVLGRIPKDGVLVALLVHYRGSWVPFRDPRTNRHGRFKVAYRFQGARGRFPFRARVPGGQAGFPFARAESEVIHVHTR